MGGNSTAGVDVAVGAPEADDDGDAQAYTFDVRRTALACGFLGLEGKVKPRGEAIGEAYGRDRDLPYSQLESVEMLEACEPLGRILGREFIRIYCAVKRAEHEQFMRVISPWEREHLLLNV